MSALIPPLPNTPQRFAGFPITGAGNVGAVTVDEPVSNPQSFTGKLLGGKYLVGERIGSGGMAVVYEATNVETKERVAVKQINEQSSGRADREIETSREVAKLKNPNIVKFVSGGNEYGYAYFVMELVEGPSLKDVLETIYADSKHKLIKTNQVSFSPKQVLEMFRDVSHALALIHDKGFFHRDIKPSNLLIDKNGVIKISDLGLAKPTLFNEEDWGRSITRSNMPIGTLLYMSPEQARGQELSDGADVYSLGVTLYELLTGKLPVPLSQLSEIAEITNTPPVPPVQYNNSIPRTLNKLILDMLLKFPYERPSASEVEERLSEIITSDEIKGLTFNKPKFILAA